MTSLLRTMEKEQLCSEHAAECFIAAKKRDDRIQKAAPQMLSALRAVKARLDRNGMSGRQLPEYQMVADAIEKAIGK